MEVSTSSERQEWYRRFLNSRCPPFTRSIPSNIVSEGYAIIVTNVSLAILEEGSTYHLNMFLYDGVKNHFFGNDLQSVISECKHKELIFNEEIFFHAPVISGVHFVIEIVGESRDGELNTIAWTVLALGESSVSLPYFGQHGNAPTSRLKLYPGSPKFLLISNTLTNFEGLNGSAEIMFLSHPNLSRVSDFFPEYFLVGLDDIIPGVIPEGIRTCESEPRVMGYIDGIGLSFGETNAKVEGEIEDSLTQEWAYKANELKPNERMEIIERRLRIGVHNGLAYVSSPLTVHLIPQEELLSGTQTLRRKARSNSGNRNDKRVSSHSLVVRSRMSLPIVRDIRFAIVFSIDYLLGVRAHDGTVSNSQSILIGWGIALPFSSSPNSFYLIGGPRANPDEVLCFKSLLRLSSNRQELPLDTSNVSLSFHFYLQDTGSETPISHPHHHQEQREEVEGREEIDEPNKERNPSPIRNEEIEVDEEVIIEDEERVDEIVPVRRDDTRRRIERDKKKERDRLPPIENNTIQPYKEYFIEKDLYIPPKANISPLARSSLALLSTIKFESILDRNGDIPIIVDPCDRRVIDLSIESHDRLASNQIVFQFLAMKWNKTKHHMMNVFFTMQFFRFTMVTSERLYIDQNTILRRLQSINGREDPAGFTAIHIVDRSSLSSSDELAIFLSSNEIQIEVWDADSLLLLGTVSVPLRGLCRRGSESVQFYGECPIIQSSYQTNQQSLGTLYIRFANIGHPFSNQLDMISNRSSSSVYHTLRSISDSNDKNGMIVRAKPLSASHQSSLQRFLKSQQIDMHRRYAEMFNEQNLNSMREWEELKKKIPGSAHHQATLKRFIFEGELEAYRKARGESKANKLLAAVFKGVTVSHTITCSVGEIQVFEFLLTNPFPTPFNCSIQMADPSISMIRQQDEWESWKKRLRKFNREDIHIDSTIFSSAKDDQNILFLHPNESILIPFKFDGLRVSSSKEIEDEVKIVFKGIGSGEPLSVLDLKIHRRPFALNKIYRFMADELTNFEKNIRLKSHKRILGVRCSDPSVKVSILQDKATSQLIRITAYTGPSMSIRMLNVFLYEDLYCHSLIETWNVIIHSLCRIDVHSVQGQTTKVNLPFPTDIKLDDTLYNLHSTSSSIEVPHPQPMNLSNNSQLHVYFTPNERGSNVSLISLTEGSPSSLINVYSLHSHITQPHITSQFQIQLDSRRKEPTLKRLAIHNAYSIPRTYRLVSSRPDLMKPINELINISPSGVASPPLQFVPVSFSERTVDMYLFIQDAETGQEEETYSLSIIYKPQ